MATGSVTWFAQGLADLMTKKHDLSADALKLAIVTTATVPSKTTAAPHFAGTGTTDFSASQVATHAGGYTGPIALTTPTVTIASGVPTFRADIVSVPVDAGGFSNGAYGIIYNSTDANKRALAYVELSAGGTLSNVSGALTIDWAGATNDILTLTAQ
jgi:hypothetical protein